MAFLRICVNHPAVTIITELETKDGRKIAVGVRLENRGNDLIVNEIATIHGKTNNHLLADWAKSTPEWLAENINGQTIKKFWIG